MSRRHENALGCSAFGPLRRLGPFSLVCALVVPQGACKADAPASSRPFVPSASASSADLPAGFTPASSPNDEQRSAANISNNEWRVGVEDQRLAISKRDRKTPKPTLPFTIFENLRKEGMSDVSAVMQTSDGLLVGFDGGEWGGGLYWFAPDGKKYAELGNSNVHGLVLVADDEVLSLEGLNHGGSREGAARWVERASGKWATATSKDLGAGPETFVSTKDFVLVVTPESVVRILRNRTTEVVLRLDVSLLYPNSMVPDAKGHFWIGMRGFVVELVPAGTTFTPQWFMGP